MFSVAVSFTLLADRRFKAQGLAYETLWSIDVNKSISFFIQITLRATALRWKWSFHNR